MLDLKMKAAKILAVTMVLQAAAVSAQGLPSNASNASSASDQALRKDLQALLRTDCASPAEARKLNGLLEARRAEAMPLLLDAVRQELDVLERNAVLRQAVLEYDRVKQRAARDAAEGESVAGVEAVLGKDPAAFAARRLREFETAYKRRAADAVIEFGRAEDIRALESLAARPGTDPVLKRAIAEGIQARKP